MTINVLFVYGAGNDNLFGGGLRRMQDDIREAGLGDQVHLPRIIDYTEYQTLLRLMQRWNDPTILVGHSCGCNAITHAAVELSMEPIPYLMGIAPSRFCPVAPLPPNVLRATQVTSNRADVFNPGGAQLLKLSPINDKTKLDVIVSGLPHVAAPFSQAARSRLLQEIRLALDAQAVS